MVQFGMLYSVRITGCFPPALLWDQLLAKLPLHGVSAFLSRDLISEELALSINQT